jgi:uncharacterized membrane protein YccC
MQGEQLLPTDVVIGRAWPIRFANWLGATFLVAAGNLYGSAHWGWVLAALLVGGACTGFSQLYGERRSYVMGVRDAASRVG